MGALNQSGGRSAVKTFKKRARVDKTGVKGGTVSLGKRRSEDDMDVYLPVKLKKSKEGSVQGDGVENGSKLVDAGLPFQLREQK
jgi:hypothetical protein